MEFTNEIYLASRESHLNDPIYRYKIKPLNIKCLGRQDNWTTHFLNSEEIAKKINRPSEHFGKYIGYALSCPMKQYKDKNCLTFKGDHSSETITKYFMEFVKIYVLCPNCDLPETKLFVQKDLRINVMLVEQIHKLNLNHLIKLLNILKKILTNT